jgi:hypothetical protein
MRGSTERAVATEYTERFSVRMTGVDQLVGALSGGNQQKVVSPSGWPSKPRVLILERADPRDRHRRQGRGPPDHLELRRIRPRGSSSSRATCPRSSRCRIGSSVMHEGGITAKIARADATEEAGDVRRDRAASRRDPTRHPNGPGPRSWLRRITPARRHAGTRLARSA